MGVLRRGHGVEIDSGPALIQAWKCRLQPLIKHRIEQRGEGREHEQFIEYRLIVESLLVRDGRALVLEYVTLDDLECHLDLVAGSQGFTLRQRHQCQ